MAPARQRVAVVTVSDTLASAERKVASVNDDTSLAALRTPCDSTLSSDGTGTAIAELIERHFGHDSVAVSRHVVGDEREGHRVTPRQARCFVDGVVAARFDVWWYGLREA